MAVGGKTQKMHQGHHGANHPVKDLTTGKVEITSMNHGFALDGKSLPANAVETHISLFDGSNCGIALKDKPVFSVQYHPEASPGPRDCALPVHALRRHDAAGEAQERLTGASRRDGRTGFSQNLRHSILHACHEACYPDAAWWNGRPLSRLELNDPGP